MTRNAFAIVVGINAYDNTDIPTLNGSTYDARTAVDWLLRIGVPAPNILLHMSPSPPAGVLPHGVTAQAATGDLIVASFFAVSQKAGDQLFVFMSGHGLSVPGPTGGPTFLAQDYGPNPPASGKNLRIEGYINWMVHWDFPFQFLFYDACQNPSTLVGRVSLLTAMDPPGLAALPVTLRASLLACYSASPGQRAWAGTGQGVLVHNVLSQLDPAALAAIDPNDQLQGAVLYDWATGARAIDMRRLFDDIVADQITQEAAIAGVVQTPYSQPYGKAAGRLGYPIVALPAEAGGDLVITVDPAAAVSSLKQLRLSIQTPARNLYMPSPGIPLPNPFVCKAPTNAEVTASCMTSLGASWIPDNSPQKATINAASQPITLSFVMQPPMPAGGPPTGPANTFNIRVTGPDGAPDFQMDDARYAHVSAKFGAPMEMPDGVVFEHHENGPDISFDAATPDAERNARRIAKSWQSALRNHRAGDGTSISFFPPGIDPDGKSPNIRFLFGEGGPAGLAGYLVGESVVSVTAIGSDDPALQLSPSAIAAHSDEWLEPGPYRVTVNLPWGRLSHIVQVPDTGDPVALKFPDRIGREPLRNAWLRSRDAASGVRPITDDERRQLDPALADIPFLVASNDGDDRVEPFSETDLLEWDLLFSAGRLDGITPARLEAIALYRDDALSPQQHDLLMIGLGHVALHLSQLETLGLLLRRVEGAFRQSVDFALLDWIRAKMLGESEEPFSMRSELLAQFAPPIALGWSAPLLASLLQHSHHSIPPSITRLSQSSIIAVRTLADADEMALSRALTSAGKSVARPERPALDAGLYTSIQNAIRDARGQRNALSTDTSHHTDEGESEAEA